MEQNISHIASLYYTYNIYYCYYLLHCMVFAMIFLFYGVEKVQPGIYGHESFRKSTIVYCS